MTTLQSPNACFPTRVAFLPVTSVLCLLLLILTLSPAHGQAPPTTQPAKTTPLSFYEPVINSPSPKQLKAIQAQIDKLAKPYASVPDKSQIRIKLVMSDGKPLPKDARPIVFNFIANAKLPRQPLSPESSDTWSTSASPGFIAVTAFAPGYIADLKGPIWVTPAQNAEPHIVTLTPLPVTTVRFIDEKGNPIKPDRAQFSLTLTSQSAFPSTFHADRFEWSHLSPPIDPEPDGSFRIVIDSSLNPRIRAFAPGYQAVSHDLTNPKLATAPNQILVMLEKSQSISGRVIDAQTNQPIPGASIRSPRYQESTEYSPSITTDAQGAFTLYGQFPITPDTRHSKGGPFQATFLVTAPGHAPQNFTVVQAGPITRDIKLIPRQPSTITITGDLSRLPGYPQNPRLTAFTQLGSIAIPIIIKDNTGYGSIPLPDSPVRFGLRDPSDFALSKATPPPATQPDTPPAITVDIPSNPTSNSTATPGPGIQNIQFLASSITSVGAIFGKVVDEDDNPLTDYAVNLATDKSYFNHSQRQAFGSEQGFALTQLKLGDRYTLLISLPNQSQRSIPCADIKLTEFCPIQRLKIVLKKDGSVSLLPPQFRATDVSYNPGKYAVQIGLFTGRNSYDNLNKAVAMAEKLKLQGLNLHTCQNNLTGDAIVLLGSFGSDYYTLPQIMTGPHPTTVFLDQAEKLRKQYPLMSVNADTPQPNAPPSTVITIPRFGPYIPPPDDAHNELMPTISEIDP